MTQRNYKSNDYLTVYDCIITKEGVYKYLGKEIYDYKNLGLEPSKTYNVFRSTDEIKQGIDTFDNNPLIDKHIEFSTDNLPPTIGSVSNVHMDGKELKGDVTFWDKSAIDELHNGKKGLSVGYNAVYVLKDGKYGGIPYELIQTNLVANHVAHVPNPRVPEAQVLDSNIYEDNKMSNVQTLDANKNVEPISNVEPTIMDNKQTEDDALKAKVAKKAKKLAKKEAKKEAKKKAMNSPSVVEDKKATMDEDSLANFIASQIKELEVAKGYAIELLGGVNQTFDSADNIYNAILKHNGYEGKKFDMESKRQMVDIISNMGKRPSAKQMTMDSLYSNDDEAKIVKQRINDMLGVK